MNKIIAVGNTLEEFQKEFDDTVTLMNDNMYHCTQDVKGLMNQLRNIFDFENET